MAATDLPAQLEYQSRIEEFHGRLREFYYTYLFAKRPFAAADYSKAPHFSPSVSAGSVDVLSLAALALLASLASLLAWLSMLRAQRPREHRVHPVSETLRASSV
jgi:ABC-2 type transport system permease protein